MPSALQFYQRVPMAFFGGDDKNPLDLYVKCIRKILKDEQLAQLIPPTTFSSGAEIPQELLAMAFDGVTSFFRGGTFNDETAPDAYKLVKELRPHSTKKFSRFTTTEEKSLLKALQLYANFTLGLMAWDKKDRATAAKRYQETLDLAATHPSWNTVDPQSKHLDRWVINCVQQVKKNLSSLVRNDTINSERAQRYGLRRDVLPTRNTWLDVSGGVHIDETFSVATDSCGSCGKREIKVSRCTGCKKVAYCGRNCQKADWKAHKTVCRATAA